MDLQFIAGIFVGVVVFVTGNLLLAGIKGENKKVSESTFYACIEGVNKRLEHIENRITRIEEILLTKKIGE